MDRAFEMGSDQEWAAMEEKYDGDGDVDVGRREDGPAAPAALSGKKLWRMARAVHLVLARGLGKHQPKLAALGVHLHHLLSPSSSSSSSKRRSFAAPALSCRSVDAVHPYPYRGGASSSLSCRSMDPGAAVYSKYEYRPREVEFSCSSTPLHRRRSRRRPRRRGGLLLQQQQDEMKGPKNPEYGSAAAVTRLFELMDDDEEEGDVVEISGAPAPRQVRITDSPFPAAREEDDEAGLVDRRADEFIVWFHGQLRMQQQPLPQQRPAAARERATYGVR